MKKIWSYVAMFFIGVSAGLIAMYKLTGEQIKVTVRKVKNKRTSGNTSTTIPINVETSKKRPKRTRKDRIAARKQKKGK